MELALATIFSTSFVLALSGMTLDEPASPTPAAADRNLVVTGLLLSAVNPCWLIWWASIGLAYIVHSMKFGMLGITAFFCGHILADMAWYTLVSFGIARGRHLLGNGLYQKMIGGCAVFLIAFGCWFFYSGATKATNVYESTGYNS